MPCRFTSEAGVANHVKSGKSWFNRFKNERVPRRRQANPTPIKAAACECPEVLYNGERLHPTLGFRSPAKARDQGSVFRKRQDRQHETRLLAGEQLREAQRLFGQVRDSIGQGNGARMAAAVRVRWLGQRRPFGWLYARGWRQPSPLTWRVRGRCAVAASARTGHPGRRRRHRPRGRRRDRRS